MNPYAIQLPEQSEYVSADEWIDAALEAALEIEYAYDQQEVY